MNGRRFLIGALVASAVAFLLSGLWHIVLMGDFYESATVGGREAPLMWAVALAYLMVGAIMAYMYPKGYEGGSPAPSSDSSGGFRRISSCTLSLKAPPRQ